VRRFFHLQTGYPFKRLKCAGKNFLGNIPPGEDFLQKPEE
jgi:hypothetical protein